MTVMVVCDYSRCVLFCISPPLVRWHPCMLCTVSLLHLQLLCVTLSMCGPVRPLVCLLISKHFVHHRTAWILRSHLTTVHFPSISIFAMRTRLTQSAYLSHNQNYPLGWLSLHVCVCVFVYETRNFCCHSLRFRLANLWTSSLKHTAFVFPIFLGADFLSPPLSLSRRIARYECCKCVDFS